MTDTFDHLDPSVSGEDVLARYAVMRDECPVAHIPRHGGYRMISRYDDVRELASDAERFISGKGCFIPPSGLPPVPPIEFDGAERLRWRKILQGALRTGLVRQAEPMITAVVREHIAAFRAAGSAELVSQFAEPVPAAVIGRLIGLAPERATQMRTVTLAAFAAVGTAEMPDRLAEFGAFIHRELTERRAEPADDFLTSLALGRVDDEQISDAEVPGVLISLMLGGHHSTSAAVAGLVHHVLSVPGLRARLATEPELLSPVIEESLRLSTPLHLFGRTAAVDTEVHGEPIREGERVMLNYGSANLDPRRFADPVTFRLDRAGDGHLAFGAGVHLCQGAALARTQLRVALTELLALPNLALNGPVRRSGLIGGALMTLTELPVSFSVPSDHTP